MPLEQQKPQEIEVALAARGSSLIRLLREMDDREYDCAMAVWDDGRIQMTFTPVDDEGSTESAPVS
jgi:hypothetical protein